MLGSEPAGFERCRQMQHESRKQQWLASRVLLRELAHNDAEIIYDEHNKPFVQDSKMSISLSHSYGLVALIIDLEKETGIDIELVKPKIERIADKFMSDEEMLHLDKKNRIEALYVHWCAKEALYKLYGKKELIFKEDLPVSPFIYEGSGVIEGCVRTHDHDEKYRLRYEETGEHMLVYVSNG